MSVVECRRLGKRYGRVAALVDCQLSIPEGHLVALIGPNGAGKSTLLNLIVGLATPTTGEVCVLDGLPAGSLEALDAIAFVAQDTPLYRGLSASDMIHLTRNLNRQFDEAYARRRLDELGIASSRRVGKLSGGQRAQLALTLALARHPRVLVLDEPTASLDPVARHDFMATVVAAMADDGITVLLSSHALAELERVADYLVLIAAGRVRLNGTTEELIRRHRFLSGPAGQPRDPHWRTIQDVSSSAQTHLLVEDMSGAPAAVSTTPGWEERTVSVEQLALAYLRENPAPHATPLAGVER